MNQRERTLLLAIVVAAGGLLSWKVVIPRWLAPMFDYEAKITEKTEELKTKISEISELDDAREKYRDYVYRTGGTDEKDVGDRFHGTLNDLLNQCRLEDVRVTPKSSGSPSKTGLMTLNYNIRASGPLQQAVLFLKSFYELPHIARFKDFKLTPQQARRRGQPSDAVDLSGDIEVLVPPTFFSPIRDPLEHQPPRLVKYHTDHFASIWEKQPFTRPPVAVAKVEPPPTQPPPPPPPPGWTGDPLRNQKKIVGCWAANQEVMVTNTASNQREYVRVGGQLDGGRLLLVHPYGVMVRRKEGNERREYLYPLGEMLSSAVALAEATREPQLRAAARHYLTEEKPSVEGAESNGAVGTPDPTAGASGELAGPPENLAGPLVQATPVPAAEVSVSQAPPPTTSVGEIPPPVGHPERRPGWPTTDLAGPPVELAGPIVEPKGGKP
jgi:hypothetical protein